MQTTIDSVKPSTPSPPLLRLSSVLRMTGLGRSTIYRMIAKKQFPHPVRLSMRAVAWRQVDLDSWIEGRAEAH